jgi:Cdc6-like AAA superfamily ATPase
MVRYSEFFEGLTANISSGVLLNCGVHSCPHSCHQLQDHSKMPCESIVTSQCVKNHKITRKCHDKAAAICQKCEAAQRAQEKRRQRDHKLDQEREAKQQAYLARLVDIEDKIEHEKRLLKNRAEAAEQDAAIAQKERDLENFKKRAAGSVGNTHSSTPTQVKNPNEASHGEQNTVSKPPNTLGSQVKPTNKDMVLPKEEQSDAKDDWEHQKKMDGAQSTALDSLMSMIGLESVKEQFLGIKSKIDTLVRQGVPLSGERFGAALLGNPGTGKTTVARLYAEFLGEVGALPGDFFFETSGSALANEGVSACKDHIKTILEAGGGVFFIDETYQLVSGNSPGGKAVLDYLLAEIENLTGKIAFVMAGYHKQMEAFFAHNPGIPSRIPMELEFHDYNDQQLQRIFCHYVDKKYRTHMKVEDGMSGLFVRIIARRIGRGRGREGFGNARDVQNKISQITTRQAKRLRKERKSGLAPDDNLLTKEDLIGPEPASVLKNNPALIELQNQIGLTSVKESVQSLLDGIQTNYRREIEEKPLVQYSLNKCFIGSPGTGKTTVAKLYGRILADIGLLSNGEGELPQIHWNSTNREQLLPRTLQTS